MSFSLLLYNESDSLEFKNQDIVGQQDVMSAGILPALHSAMGTGCRKCAKFSNGCVLVLSLLSTAASLPSEDFQRLLIQSSSSCDILFWYGQVLTSTDPILAKQFESQTVDTGLVLMNALSENKNVDSIADLISSLIGSFILIFVDVDSDVVYFTRDRFGRHSMVARRFPASQADRLCIDLISSLVVQDTPFSPESSLESIEKNAQDWFEIPACGIFVSKVICDNESLFLSNISLYPWSDEHLILCPSDFPVSVNRVLHRNEDYNSIFLPVYKPTTLKETQEKLLHLLLTVVHDSVTRDLLFCEESTDFGPSDGNRSGALFGLLFSGGLDSSVIAALIDRFVPAHQSIDLINVAFQRIGPNLSANNKDYQDVNNLISAEEAPDRQTALKSYDELCKLSPQRKWNLIKVNVDVAEIQETRVKHVWPLLLPGHTTVLDDSLGLALWFAARGQGVLHTLNGLDEQYTSSAKFLFLGSGIDEQLAGYARHLTTYKKFGPEALRKELSKETLCISNRNLGRDDRVLNWSFSEVTAKRRKNVKLDGNGLLNAQKKKYILFLFFGYLFQIIYSSTA
ncbi:unnamed protein product [Heterobilharzia americana]|nr:unnamed protein product [Heterobilharzia americana]